MKKELMSKTSWAELVEKAKQMKLSVELEGITPDVAATYLKENRSNRPISPQRLRRWAKVMKELGWKINGSTIIFGSDGRLLDGQHRLEACVLAGVGFFVLVVRGIDPSVFDTIDTGKVKNGADTLKVLGIESGKGVAAALRHVDAYFKEKMGLSNDVGNTEIVELAKAHPEVENSVSRFGSVKLMSGALASALHYLFAKKDEVAATEFFTALKKGTAIQEGSGLFLLRERLIANSLAKAKLGKRDVAALVIRAWNADRSGEVIKCLKWASAGEKASSFPKIL